MMEVFDAEKRAKHFEIRSSLHREKGTLSKVIMFLLPGWYTKAIQSMAHQDSVSMIFCRNYSDFSACFGEDVSQNLKSSFSQLFIKKAGDRSHLIQYQTNLALAGNRMISLLKDVSCYFFQICCEKWKSASHFFHNRSEKVFPYQLLVFY